MTKSRTALVLFAHGSSVESANEAVREIARQMAAASGWLVEAAFLDGGNPNFPSSIAGLTRAGVERVVVVPYFLTTGLHLQRDLPKLIREAMLAHPTLKVEVTPPLDGHPAMVGILLDRAAAVLAEVDH